MATKHEAPQSVSASPVDQFESHSVSGRRVEVVFGSPRHDCAGMGICRIEPDLWDNATVRLPGSPCCHAPAYAAGDDFGRLLLHFPLEELPARVRSRYFSSGLFEIPDPVPVPEWLLREIFSVTCVHYRIAPYRYPTLETRRLLTVSLRLMVASASVATVRNLAA